METTLTNVNAYENAVRTQAGAADIRAQLLDSLAKSKAVVDSVFGKIEEIDRMKAESEQLRKKISTVIPGKATMLTMLSVLSLLVFGLFGAPVVLSIFRVTDPGTIYLTFILVPTVPFVSILLIRSRVVKEARAQEQADFMRDADLLDSRIQADFRQITAILESDRGIYAKNHIPEDYFYPEAVAMFQYYIRNGQADSMKEALREYDQYLHRCRLEYQATSAASASNSLRVTYSAAGAFCASGALASRSTRSYTLSVGLPLASAGLRYTVGAELSHNATAALGAIIQFRASCSPLTHCTPLCATGF